VQVGRYEILEIIGTGANSRVARQRCLVLGLIDDVIRVPLEQPLDCELIDLDLLHAVIAHEGSGDE